jgi:hypothetical protein
VKLWLSCESDCPFGALDRSVVIRKDVGQIAGIGGLALGVLLIVFRDVVRKNIFPRLPPEVAYRLLRLITLAVWSIAIVGIGAWVYVTHTAQQEGMTSPPVKKNSEKQKQKKNLPKPRT